MNFTNTFEAEKQIQYRLAEFEKNARRGLYLKQLTSEQSTAKEQAEEHRGFWHKWFGKRRLGTSWK